MELSSSCVSSLHFIHSSHLIANATMLGAQDMICWPETIDQYTCKKKIQVLFFFVFFLSYRINWNFIILLF